MGKDHEAKKRWQGGTKSERV